MDTKTEARETLPADTIRRYIGMPLGPDKPHLGFVGPNEALAALDALLAELQQLQQENSRLNVSEASWAAQALEAEAEREQAIEALREIAAISPNSNYMRKVWLIADSALSQLEEQPK